MTEPNFEGCWTIRSSTSRFFPAHSKFHLTPKPQSDEFELEVNWEEHSKLKLLERDFHKVESGRVVRGTFDHPKETPQPPKPQERFELVVTLCPVFGPDQEQYLFGLLFPKKPGREDEGTGVWVAEQKPPPPDDPPGG